MIGSYKLKDALVISNNDPDKKGRIQIRVLPDAKDIKESSLPWARNFFAYLSKSKSVLNKKYFPKDSLIRVLVSQDDQSYYFLGGLDLQGLYDFSKINDIISNVSDAGSVDYETIEFKLYENGTLWFQDNSNNNTGIIHSSGGYALFDGDGKLFIHTKNDSKIYDSNGNKIEMANSGINIEDKNGNTIQMGTTSITINNNFEVLQ